MADLLGGVPVFTVTVGGSASPLTVPGPDGQKIAYFFFEAADAEPNPNLSPNPSHSPNPNPNPNPNQARDGAVLFDSTVDDVRNPRIFVTYRDSQAYPDYLVQFRQ